MLRFLGVYFTQSVVKEGVDVLKMVFIARNGAKLIIIYKIHNNLSYKSPK